MARVRIHRLEAITHGREVGRRLVTKVVGEIRALAVFETAFGPYTTGNLALHMESEVIDVPTGIRGRVFNRLPYAQVVHDGASQHMIFPRPPRTYLKFHWRKVGRVVYLDRVRHPGMKGKKYLTKHLAAIARANNMRYIIYDR